MLLKDALKAAVLKYEPSRYRNFDFDSVFDADEMLAASREKTRIKRLKRFNSKYRVASLDAHSENESARDPCEASPVHGEASLVISDCGEFSSSCQ